MIIETLKRNAHHFIAILVFMCASMAYFGPQLQGKKIVMHDIVQHQGSAQEVKEFKEKTGEVSLWTNSSFSGMPTYQMGAPQRTNLIQHIDKYLHYLGVGRPISYFFMAMAYFYLLLILLRVNPWLAIGGSIAYAFSSYNLIIYFAGHASKFRVLLYWPLIAAGVFTAYNSRRAWGGVLLFSIGMALSLYVHHPQMVYYLGILLLVYVISEAISAVNEGRIAQFAKVSGLLFVGLLLAMGTSASKLMTSAEFVEQTIRGPHVLESEKAKKGSSSGLDKDYTFSYSNGLADLVTVLIPGFVGGGSQESITESSAVYQDLRGKGVRDKRALKTAPLYWGSLPVTAGPAYFGAAMIFLFFLGLLLADNRWRWWILVATILSMLLSLGKNMPFLSNLFFDYFPLFNRFRAPSSMIVIAQFLVPLLGILGLSAFINSTDTEKRKKALFTAAGITGGLAAVMAIFGPSMASLSGANDMAYQNAGYNLEAIYADRTSLLRGDALRSLALIAALFGTLYVYHLGKIKVVAVGVIFAIITLFDLVGVGTRYLSYDTFVSEGKYKQEFKETEAIRKIKTDPDPHFRVMNLTTSTFNEAMTSYHVNSIGGYDAAKLRRYQDLIEKQISKNNRHVFNMLNTRYFVVNDGEKGATPKLNPDHLGNAWLVNKISLVKSNDEEINSLREFDPKNEAIIHEEFKDQLKGLNLSGRGSIILEKYAPNKLTYRSTTTAEELAIFSEVWYGPNLGWQAYIDDQPVEHFRANYILRALKIPAGEHKIVFEFDPQTYRTGELISLIASLLLIGLCLAAVFFGIRSSRNKEEELAVA